MTIAEIIRHRRLKQMTTTSRISRVPITPIWLWMHKAIVCLSQPNLLATLQDRLAHALASAPTSPLISD